MKIADLGKILSVLSLVGSIGYAAYSMYAENKSLNSEVDQLRSQVNTYLSQLSEQTEAVNKLQAETAERELRVQEALREAQKLETHHYQVINKLKSRQGLTCKDIDNLIMDYSKGIEVE